MEGSRPIPIGSHQHSCKERPGPVIWGLWPFLMPLPVVNFPSCPPSYPLPPQQLGPALLTSSMSLLSFLLHQGLLLDTLALSHSLLPRPLCAKLLSGLLCRNGGRQPACHLTQREHKAASVLCTDTLPASCCRKSAANPPFNSTHLEFSVQPRPQSPGHFFLGQGFLFLSTTVSQASTGNFYRK